MRAGEIRGENVGLRRERASPATPATLAMLAPGALAAALALAQESERCRATPRVEEQVAPDVAEDLVDV